MRFDWPEVKDVNIDGNRCAQILQEIKKNRDIQLWGGEKISLKKGKTEIFLKV